MSDHMLPPGASPVQTDPSDSPVQPEADAKLYSEGQVSVGAVLGGPVAAGWMMSRNYKTLGIAQHARLALWITGAFALVFIAVAMIVPTDFPNAPFAVVTAAVAYAFYRQLQKASYEEHVSAGGERRSNWAVVATVVCSVPVTIAFAVLVFMALPLEPVNSVIYDTNVVYYEGDAEREDARSLGDYLVEQGFMYPDDYHQVTLVYPSDDRFVVEIKMPLLIDPPGTPGRRDFEEFVKDLGARYYGRTLVFHVQNEFGITVERISPP